MSPWRGAGLAPSAVGFAARAAGFAERAGRFVAGFGGGLLGAVSYVVVRDAFPERTWSRVIALLSGMWSVSIVVGPLAGGVFALWGAWRGVFVAVMALAALLAPIGIFAFWEYYQAGNVNGKVALLVAIGFAIGGYFGGNWAQHISGNALRKSFAVLLALTAVKMFWQKQ